MFKTGKATLINAAEYCGKYTYDTRRRCMAIKNLFILEFGRFQIYLLITCMLTASITSMVPNVIEGLMSKIACDLQLYKDDRIMINAIVYTCECCVLLLYRVYYPF